MKDFHQVSGIITFKRLLVKVSTLPSVLKLGHLNSSVITYFQEQQETGQATGFLQNTSCPFVR